MRFVEVVLEAFQAVEHAHVQLGPGLNVLYGPNDLGKSTLVSAIRAALLVQPKAKEAERFSSWYADAVPRVALTFSDDQERFWRVKKAFGSGSSAELLHSKDGKDFTIDCKAREVEERVRSLLGWGIPAPGGKGAARGLPDSFLASVLLAAQTDVDVILGASLEKDQDDSGKIRLRKALATLAQDPLFKRVLDAAQAEYDQHFTDRGRLRRTQGSKLMAADRVVKDHQTELQRLGLEYEESRGIEALVVELRDARLGAEVAVSDAQAALAQARTGLANTRLRSEAEQQLTAADQALAEIDAQAARVAALGRDNERLVARVELHKTALANAAAECERFDAAERAAEDLLRSATSDAAEQQRKIRVAELSTEAAQLVAARAELEGRQKDAKRAHEALEALQLSTAALAACREKLAASADQLAEARSQAERADQERDLTRAVLAYGRWRAAQDAATRIEQTRQQLASLTTQATAMEAEEKALREQHARRTAEIAERRSKLPTPERFKQLTSLRQELDIAQAALGGGLSIVVTPRVPQLTLSAIVDRTPPSDAQVLTSERVFEAERSARLRIGDLVEIEVTVGAADTRRAVVELQQRWEHEVTPVLERATVSALSSIERALAALLVEDESARTLREQADARAGDARSTRERVALLSKQLDGAQQDPGEVSARRSAIGSISLDLLEPRWNKLGARWEERAEVERERAEQAQTQARERCSTLDQDQKLRSYQLSQADDDVRERSRSAETLGAVLDGCDASKLLRELGDQLGALAARESAIEAALGTLAQRAGAERAEAERALQAARESCERARAMRSEAQAALERSQAELNTALGEAKAQAEQLARMDRPRALLRREACGARLLACPTAPQASDAEVAAADEALTRAERLHDERREELHKSEGALTKVGGAQLRDRLQQEQEALDSARARERDLKVDADAWKLLREALREAENADSEHLGSALGRPVGDKLHELTQGRYGNLGFDQHLVADRLKAHAAPPDADVLDALSVGTRNQLATLVRLTIASQLKSAIILDDHLVHTDPTRLRWFRDVLRKTALDTQVLIFTCRPEDYLDPSELPTTSAQHDLAGGTIRAIDLTRVLRRWETRERRDP